MAKKPSFRINAALAKVSRIGFLHFFCSSEIIWQTEACAIFMQKIDTKKSSSYLHLSLFLQPIKRKIDDKHQIHASPGILNKKVLI